MLFFADQGCCGTDGKDRRASERALARARAKIEINLLFELKFESGRGFEEQTGWFLAPARDLGTPDEKKERRKEKEREGGKGERKEKEKGRKNSEGRECETTRL